ncbi:MAG: flagellar basal-body MS-ring/collar protein FliF [Rhodospirillales bacterium]
MQKLVVLFQTLGPTRSAFIGVVAALMIGVFGWLMLGSNTTSQSLLYADLDMGEASRIVQHLEMAKVAYRLADDGTAVYVPSDQVGRLRVSLAEQGLPSGGSTGYEIFDRSDALGSTNFQQNVNLVRALEGELGRTIRSIANVKSARVHLVIPRRDLFSRERQEPSASVLLQMRGAGRLSPAQVSAVQHLISTAVPGLSVGRISIVDAQGTLLSSSQDEGDAGSAGDGRTDERRRQVESRLARTIDQLIERTVGPGRVRSEVSAEMDFDLINTSEEIFNPDGQVVRSTQTVDQSGTNSEREASSAVSVATNLPDATANAGNGPSTVSADKHSEETVNYEISKKVINHVREAGIVKRLSVAVLVDGTYAVAADGTRTYNPRPQEELDQLAGLVRNAVGFNKDRGDTIEVVNMRFAEIDATSDEAPAPSFFGFERQDIILAAKYLAIFLFAVLVLVLVIRPLTQRAFAAMPAAGLPVATKGLIGTTGNAGALAVTEPGLASGEQHLRLEDASEEEMINVNRIEGRVRASSLKRVGEIVERHPDETLAIVRSWLHTEE